MGTTVHEKKQGAFALAIAVLAAFMIVAVPATAESWTPTGSLNTARNGHTATLLPDGEVLVAGGSGPNTLTSTAELYSPSTGTWTFTGSMSVARSGHTATLLPDGQVLVVGGGSVNGGLASAELYDPSSGTWSPTGSMSVARRGHTATLLPNGQVLVAGGSVGCCYTPTSAAEVYDPTTGTWSPTGSMSVARVDHTATLLPNGDVVVVASYSRYYDGDGATRSRSAELYDPVRGTWTRTSSRLNIPRSGGHTATLLPDGEVLVAGGYGGSNSLGSTHFPNYLTDTELYDPIRGTWGLSGSMNTARLGHTATSLADGRVLVAGGANDNPGYYTTQRLRHGAARLV